MKNNLFIDRLTLPYFSFTGFEAIIAFLTTGQDTYLKYSNFPCKAASFRYLQAVVQAIILSIRLPYLRYPWTGACWATGLYSIVFLFPDRLTGILYTYTNSTYHINPKTMFWKPNHFYLNLYPACRILLPSYGKQLFSIPAFSQVYGCWQQSGQLFTPAG